MTGFSLNPDIDQTITAAANRYGLDPNAMRAIAYIESRGNPNAKNPNSSAGGLYQFIDGTAKQYGLQDRYDPNQAADAGARLARDNTAHLRRVLGREPTAGELYLAHQQGAGGATKLLRDPNARAVDIVGADAVRLNGGNANMSAGEFAQLWTNKADTLVGGSGAPSMGGQSPANSGAISNDVFFAALQRIQGSQQTPQTTFIDQFPMQGGQRAPLSTSQKLGGIGAALTQLDQGRTPTFQMQGQVNLQDILTKARGLPAFQNSGGLRL